MPPMKASVPCPNKPALNAPMVLAMPPTTSATPMRSATPRPAPSGDATAMQPAITVTTPRTVSQPAFFAAPWAQPPTASLGVLGLLLTALM